MSPLRVLIADDQENEIVTAREALQAAQHHVDTATSFAEACRLAALNHYDIAVIDRGWYTDKTLADDEPKGHKGFAIADAVRAQSPDAFMILYTVHANDPLTVQQAEDRDMMCVKKSFSAEARENLAQEVIALVVRAHRKTKDMASSPAPTGPASHTKAEEKRAAGTVPASATPDLGPRVQLLRTLDTRLNDSELRTLCFYLKVDYEKLPGETKTDKARELIVHLEQRGRLRELRPAGKALRPDIDWDD